MRARPCARQSTEYWEEVPILTLICHILRVRPPLVWQRAMPIPLCAHSERTVAREHIPLSHPRRMHRDATLGTKNYTS